MGVSSESRGVCLCVCVCRCRCRCRCCVGRRLQQSTLLTPQPCPSPGSANSESEGRQTASRTQCYEPPSQRPSLGTALQGSWERPPSCSGYPFGSDPRPGLSQTVPRPIPLYPAPPQELPTPY